MVLQCSKGHSCALHALMPCADPGLSLLRTKQSREGGEDTIPLQSCRAGHHPSTAASSQGRCYSAASGGDTAVPEPPSTYVNLAEDDIDDAANHYEEVKDIPGVSEVALSGRSQRRVNMQGCKSRRRQTLEPRGRGTEGSSVTVTLRRRDSGQTWHPLLGYLVLSCNGGE